MVTRALTQTCRVLLQATHPSISLPRLASTTQYQHTKAAPPSSKPSPPPSDQKPRQTSRNIKPSDRGPKPNGQKTPGATPHPGPPRPGQPGSSNINSKVLSWARAHGVGTPPVLRQQKLRTPAAKTLSFKFAPQQVFRASHVFNFFMGWGHVLTEYWLYRYEEMLAEPLWVHISGSLGVKPVVRNFARRRVREGIRTALAERGYTLNGKAIGGADGGKGAPVQELKGTISVYVNDPVSTVNLEREDYVEIGREIVSIVESRQAASQSSSKPQRRWDSNKKRA